MMEAHLYGGRLDGKSFPVMLENGQMPGSIKVSEGHTYYPAGTASVMMEDGKTRRQMPRYALPQYLARLRAMNS